MMDFLRLVIRLVAHPTQTRTRRRKLPLSVAAEGWPVTRLLLTSLMSSARLVALFVVAKPNALTLSIYLLAYIDLLYSIS